MPVYILHSTIAAPRGRDHGAQHYIGYASAEGLWRRLAEHASNRSNQALIRKWHSMGARLLLANLIVDGGRSLERYLKFLGHTDRTCAICRGETQIHRAYDIANVLRSHTVHGDKRSSKPIASRLAPLSSGITTFKDGLYLQLVTPTARTQFASVGVPIGNGPGGSGSLATAPTNPSDDRSATTRRGSYGAGKIRPSRPSAPSQLKLQLERQIPIPPTYIPDDLMGASCPLPSSATTSGSDNDTI